MKLNIVLSNGNMCSSRCGRVESAYFLQDLKLLLLSIGVSL